MSKKKNKKRKGNRRFLWSEPLPKNPYTKKLKLIDSIVIGESEFHCEPDARTFTFFRLNGSVYVLVDQLVFKYEPNTEVKYFYMEGMYESDLRESIINKGGMYPNWYLSSWDNLKRMNDLGIEGLEEILDIIPWGDEEKLVQYYESEDYFLLEDFIEEFVSVGKTSQEMFLSLGELKSLLEKVEDELESLFCENDISIEDLDYYMPPEGGIYIDGVYYNETDRQWMDYWMANGNWEAVWEMQGLDNGIDKKPKKPKKSKKQTKHPANVFNQHPKQDQLKIHEIAHQLYRKNREDSDGILAGSEIENIASELVAVTEKEGFKVTFGQSKQYFNNNIKNLEKSYKKQTKSKKLKK